LTDVFLAYLSLNVVKYLNHLVAVEMPWKNAQHLLSNLY